MDVWVVKDMNGIWTAVAVLLSLLFLQKQVYLPSVVDCIKCININAIDKGQHKPFLIHFDTFSEHANSLKYKTRWSFPCFY